MNLFIICKDGRFMYCYEDDVYSYCNAIHVGDERNYYGAAANIKKHAYYTDIDKIWVLSMEL